MTKWFRRPWETTRAVGRLSEEQAEPFLRELKGIIQDVELSAEEREARVLEVERRVLEGTRVKNRV